MTQNNTVANMGSGSAGLAIHSGAHLGQESAPRPTAASAIELGNAVAPMMVVAALAALAIGLVRRKRWMSAHVQILQQTAIGPKRSLVVAQMGGELLLLGSSEAGITVLKSEVATAVAVAAADAEAAGLSVTAPAANDDLPAQPEAGRSPAPAGRLRMTPLPKWFVQFDADQRRAEERDEFEALIQESMEDQALRRKIASGRSGRVA